MFTKSKIQQITESIQLRNEFKEGLENIMEKYNIQDSIFVSINHQTCEVTKGYFAISKEFDNLKDAINECNLNNEGIRVINNEKFQVGTISNLLSACPKDSKILDITQRTEF